MWRFSGVLRRCVANALPGASIDTSLLNRFDGYGVGGTNFTDSRDQGFLVVALDSYTGKVVSHTKHVDQVPALLPVPESVLRNAALARTERGSTAPL